ncbi:hypothetical protein DID88_005767 [Monilinia fructigena]|uniref:Reverse transcriptase Ty1/copia-type domain-containing protein n=2 Tax=Monilinia fructigena TaxID=38457 RepID=A0A395IDR1_9HELO|nr:hypothetical protein DID88_005767 [Monilinia fructigena]
MRRCQVLSWLKDMILQMAVKAINDTVGPDGIVPTLLVYGTYPRMTTIDAPAATIVKRANAIKKAMAEIRRINARRQVSDALRMRNGPSTSAIHGLPVNSEVLVWREGKGTGSGKWTGPHILLRMEGETCTVELSSGPTDFRSTSVKPFYTEPEDDDDATGEEEEVVFQGAFRSSTPPADRPNLQLRHKLKSNLKNEISMVKDTPQISAFLQDDDTEEDVNIDEFDEIFVNNSDPTSAYVESRRKEIDGLMENKVFKIIPESEVPPGTRIFTSKFVDEMKNEGTEKAFPKSRLVVQAYKDGDKTSVLTQSPTIQRVSQRIIISLAATMRVSSPGISVYLRDITQAYTQSTTNLNRVFYVRAPKEFGLEKGFILHVVKPLYGVPEAGNHWFNTYHGHHKGRLKMEQSTYDPCLLHTNRMGFGIVGLQTDDTLIVADKEFARSEQEQLEKAHFMAKDREKLREGMPLKFNGGLITLKNDHIYLNQEKQCDNMRTVQSGKMDISGTRGKKRKDVTSKNQYVAQRARGAYIATVCQPEASYHLSVAAQVVDPKEDDTKKLNKVLKWQMSNQSRGLNFVPLDIDSIKLTVFTDASFANNLDFSSQIGHVTCLVDKYDNANIIHWASIKCKRITRSVLASELYGLVFGFDVGAAIKGSINAIIKPKKQIPLVICIDSKSLYELLTKLGTTAEKRLMIDIMSLRQSYERREITEIKWIDGNSNPADAMTKDRPCQALKDLIDTNKLIIKESQWVERGD